MKAVSVTQLNRFVKGLLSNAPQLQNVAVKGEVSNYTRHHTSGHLYFTLKDNGASIKCVMFAGSAKGIRFQPKNGMAVVITGSVNLYERDGSYQFYAVSMEPDGMGALFLAFEQTKARLEQAGVFDQGKKRKIPAYPRYIGIVTSKGAAALQDMLHILGRRYPVAEVLLYPAQVQGEGAADTVRQGIAALNQDGRSDVIIIGRGGGSMEDLWAFNDEALAYAIRESRIPVVSAVGHETDFTISDFAADLRAPTPSAAAELVTPNLPDVLQYMDSLLATGHSLTIRKLQAYTQRLQALEGRLLSPANVLDKKEAGLTLLQEQLQVRMERLLEQRRQRLALAVGVLEARSPLKLLKTGYSITKKDGKPLHSVTELRNWDMMETRLADGTVYSQITEVIKNG